MDIYDYVSLEAIFNTCLSSAFKETQNEIYQVLQKHVRAYYEENVFVHKNGVVNNIPSFYVRTYKFLDGLIKTTVIVNNGKVECEVGFSKEYQNHQYEDATGLDVLKWANDFSHGGKVSGHIKFWDDALEELGGEQGIKNMIIRNMRKAGLPIS